MYFSLLSISLTKQQIPFKVDVVYIAFPVLYYLHVVGAYKYWE